MRSLVWFIPAFPLLGFLTLLLIGPQLRRGAGWLATAAMGGAFVTTLLTFSDLMSRPAEERQVVSTLFRWIPSGALRVDLALLVDPLSITMCLFITGVATLIHLYAIGYMDGDPKFSKFFLYMNLFAASMLVLVLGSNLLVSFLGWEGVGLCSYLLISFWFTDEANASAGKKAFITNRVGDFGFMLATFVVFTSIGTLNYLDINAAAGTLATGTAAAIVLLFFLAATGKSAQIPLFIWLPDAMAGPTPVSALIHAATMVTSGVYLLVRLSPVLAAAPTWATTTIAWVGVLTALFAASIAVAQNDIKKVLAYSTVSQLGYMFLGVGTGHYNAAMFHMITHAFFKALLFLGAGSVIVGMSHEQDMRKMGGLRKFMPITAGTFIVGWLAIAGVPPFSGFWSKDEILAGAWGSGPGGKALWLLGLLTALLTAFYMTRQVIMTFFGKPRWTELEPAEDSHADGHHHLGPDHVPHESPWTMTVPLVVLAVLAAVGGAINLPFGSHFEQLTRWLEPVIAPVEHELGGAATLVLALIAIACAVAGIFGAIAVYSKHRVDPAKIELPILAEGWRYDSSISAFVGGPGRALFQGISDADVTVVDGASRALAEGVEATGKSASKLQNGNVRRYALSMSVGVLALLAFFIARMAI